MRRITILTAGHLVTCPRMVKAADTLAAAGYRVHVISTRYLEWATKADHKLARAAKWTWTPLDFRRQCAPLRYVVSGLRHRAARRVAQRSGQRATLEWAARAFARFHDGLAQEAARIPTDLIYGGTSGALAAAAQAARHLGVPYALDLEDFHSAEQDEAGAPFLDALAARVEAEILPGATFLTAGSPAIAAAYAEKYGIVRPVTLNNVFPLPPQPPAFSLAKEPLRAYWFSQTVGPGRGLEDAVRGLGRIGGRSELHLRGVPFGDYVETLRKLAREAAPQLLIRHHWPAEADPIDLARGYDLGLALEQGHVPNRALCRTNKSFTYMLAGLALAFTDTPGQRELGAELGEHAIVFTPGDVEAFARGLRRWAEDRGALLRAQKAAWSAAVRRWRWDHPQESGRLLALVAQVAAPAPEATLATV